MPITGLSPLCIFIFCACNDNDAVNSEDPNKKLNEKPNEKDPPQDVLDAETEELIRLEILASNPTFLKIGFFHYYGSFNDYKVVFIYPQTFIIMDLWYWFAWKQEGDTGSLFSRREVIDLALLSQEDIDIITKDFIRIIHEGF